MKLCTPSTADVVGGLGTPGVHGVSQHCAEERLGVLRAGSDVIMTVLEVFKYDQLHSCYVLALTASQQPRCALQLRLDRTASDIEIKNTQVSNADTSQLFPPLVQERSNSRIPRDGEEKKPKVQPTSHIPGKGLAVGPHYIDYTVTHLEDRDEVLEWNVYNLPPAPEHPRRNFHLPQYPPW